MKPLHWDLLGYAHRLALLRSFDFSDLADTGEYQEDVTHRLARTPWDELPHDVQYLLRALPPI